MADRGHPRARRMANVLAGHVLTEIQLMDLDEELALEAVTGTLEFSRKVITETDLDIAEQILAGGYDYEAVHLAGWWGNRCLRIE